MRTRLPRALLTALLAAGMLLALPQAALSHGEEEAAGGEQPAGGEKMSGGEKLSAEEAEIAALAKQPARVLAQQAIAMLQISGDRQEAAMRLDAALESKDKGDIDVAVLRQAMETLDGGDPEGAIPLLDRALSRPLGAESGKALHEAERSVTPASNTQDIVAMALGAALLAIGAAGLWLTRKRTRREARST